MSNGFWKWGDQVKLAREAGLSPQFVNDVLHRRRVVNRDTAKRLTAAAEKVLGYSIIPVEDWVFADVSEHPAFYGEPVEG